MFEFAMDFIVFPFSKCLYIFCLFPALPHINPNPYTHAQSFLRKTLFDLLNPAVPGSTLVTNTFPFFCLSQFQFSKERVLTEQYVYVDLMHVFITYVANMLYIGKHVINIEQRLTCKHTVQRSTPSPPILQLKTLSCKEAKLFTLSLSKIL